MSRIMKQTNVSWIGEIPVNWTTVRLKNIIVNISSGHTPLSSNEKYYCDIEDGMPWVTIGDMSDKEYVYNSSKHITNLAVLECNLNVYEPGTILYAMYASVGEVSELMVNATLNQAILGIVFDNELVNRNYVKYALKAYKPFVKSESNGTTQFNLNLQKTINLVIPYCSLMQQNKIVDAIRKKETKISTLIANEEKQIEKLKAYKQALISEVVTKGLDPNVPMKDSGVEWIGKINCNYSLYKLKYLLSEPLLYGANVIGLKNGDFRFIRITDISLDNKLKSNNDNQYLNAIDAEPFILKDGDVLFARSGATCGKSFVYYDNYGPSCFAGYLIRARFKRNLVIPKYVGYFSMSSIYDLWKNQIFIQSTIQNISANKYAYLDMVVPSIEEQHEIVIYLDKKVTLLDKMIKCHLNKIEKLKAYRQAMIYEYVTGKRKVY